MKNYDGRSHCLNAKMKFFFSSATLVALICGASVSHASHASHRSNCVNDEISQKSYSRKSKTISKNPNIPRLNIEQPGLPSKRDLAGGKQNQVQLVKKQLVNELTDEEKPVFQFVHTDGSPVFSKDNKSSYYDLEELTDHLHLTK